MSENQNSIDGREIVEQIARQQGLSDADTERLMEALDQAVSEHLEQSGMAEHKRMMNEFKQELTVLRKKGASRQAIQDTYQRYQDAGLGYPGALGQITAQELLEDVLPSVSDSLIKRPLVEQYRKEMLAARGNRQKILSIREKYERRGLNVNEIPLYQREK